MKAVITKTIFPILRDNKEVIGTWIETKFFGLTIIRKKITYPNAYGIKQWDMYVMR